MSTAQADMDDKLRNRGLATPEERAEMAKKYPGAACLETAEMTEAERKAYWRGRMSAGREHLESSKKACDAARQDERRKVWLEAAAWVNGHCMDKSPDRWMGPEATVEKFRVLAEEVT